MARGRPRKNVEDKIMEPSDDVPGEDFHEIEQEVEKLDMEAKKENPQPKVGQIVIFCKEVPQNNGRNFLKECAAIITEVAPGSSNFQPKDGAVHLVLFISHGGAVENRHNVRYSEKPEVGKWSYPNY